MNRRHFLILPVLGLLAPFLPACGQAATSVRPGKLGSLQRPASHWRQFVSREAWDVLFQEDTESPFSSPLNAEKHDGTYVCVACLQPLFSSRHKFDSGTGWPSFFQPLPDALAFRKDRSYFMTRTEYHCTRCGGHQGHVFDDGPPPTGLRYCNNGVALHFIAQGEPLPDVRV